MPALPKCVLAWADARTYKPSMHVVCGRGGVLSDGWQEADVCGGRLCASRRCVGGLLMKDFFFVLFESWWRSKPGEKPAGPKPQIHRLSSYFCKCAGMSVTARAADTKITQMSDGEKKYDRLGLWGPFCPWVLNFWNYFTFARSNDRRYDRRYYSHSHIPTVIPWWEHKMHFAF